MIEDTIGKVVFIIMLFVIVGVFIFKLPSGKKTYMVDKQYTDPKYYKQLPRRQFSADTKRRVMDAQNGYCNNCGVGLHEICEYDHIDGNKTNNEPSNCQALCANCHRIKTNEENRTRRRE